MIGLKRGIVKLAPYDKSWVREFEKEKEKLGFLLRSNFIAIEHAGSTAIPEIKAKPVIDIMVGVKSIKKEGKKCLNILKNETGYYERPKYFPKTRFLVAKGDESKRTHYIHIVKYKGGIWNRSILFRDYLRSHRRELVNYQRLKENLALKHGEDRGLYTKKKSRFIKGIIRKALGK